MTTYDGEQVEVDLKSDDELTQLLALRDYLINELVGHRCNRCQSNQLRTGDTAALTLRYEKVIERIALVRQAREVQANGKVVGLAAIRGGRATGGSAAKDTASPRLGTKNAPRRSGRRRDTGA